MREEVDAGEALRLTLPDDDNKRFIGRLDFSSLLWCFEDARGSRSSVSSI